MKKGLIFALVFTIFLSVQAEASMVAFYLVETGLEEEAVLSNRHAEIWENGFLDVFFEAGHIVSNAPILRLNAKPRGDILRAIDFNVVDVRDGGIDFVIIAMLDYTGGSQTPREITFHIYRVIPREHILERTIPGKTYRTVREEFEDIKSIVRGLVPYIGD